MFCNKLAALNQQNISRAVNQFADDWNRLGESSDFLIRTFDS